MLDTTDAPSSQDAKTLVPLSLSLVAKKEKILQMEVAKLEKVLGQRNEMLCGLRESHEYLLTTNGQLQERSRQRREKLVSLRTLLEAGHEEDAAGKPGLCDAIGVNELDATAEKCSVLSDILLGLSDKHTALEQSCMELEEQTAVNTETLRVKKERLDQVQCTLRLMHEDIHSAQWNLENDQAELTEEDKHLNAVSQSAQTESAKVEQIHTALRTEKATVGDLQTIWQNCQGMAHEEHRQLAVANEDSKRQQRELQKLFERNGATCPADEEVLEAAKDLQARLQHLNEEVTSAKFFKREIALRRKQEQDMLTITQSSIKAKDEQLTWLDRQRVHLENEQSEVAKAQASDEAAYQVFVDEHKEAMSAFEAQIKDAGKQMKTTERAISARNKKVAAISKKVAQKSKVLTEWKAKIDAKQEEVTKAAATQELVDAESLSVQDALNKELSRLEHSQQLRTTQEMAAEELRSSCAALDNESQRVRKTLATMKHTIAATQTAVKNRIDEIREKFLSFFVVEDAENLIELLNEEIESWTTRDTDEVTSAIASKGETLQQKYDALAVDTRTKYGKMLQRKEKQYNSKLEKLRAREEEKRIVISTDRPRMDEESIVERVPSTSEEVSGAEDQQVHLQSLKRPSLEGVPDKALAAKQRSSKSKPTQRKAKAATKKAPKSARRGLNLAGESPRTDNELTDVFTADATKAPKATSSQRNSLKSEGGARRTRLKRRTPAQKAGVVAAVVKNHPTAKAASITPEVVTIETSTGMSSHDPLGSPVNCELTRDNENSPKMTSVLEAPSLLSQEAAKTLPLQKVSQHSKDAVKCRKSTKISHRSRHAKTAKIGRLSLARSQGVDWSAADSFSFN